jgi:hypothetical protein
MKTKLASVLGLAVLMACFICGSSFVYADDVLEVASSAMQTLAPDANGAESVDKLPCESSCVGTEHCTGDARTVEADQPSSPVSEIEPSVTEASPAPAVQSADAIIVEVTQTVTIVVPGDDAADSEEPAVTGSILEPAATEPASVVEAAATDASPATEVTEVTEAADAVVAEVVQTVTIAAPGQEAGDSEASAVAESAPEPSATEPALTRDAELP